MAINANAPVISSGEIRVQAAGIRRLGGHVDGQ